MLVSQVAAQFTAPKCRPQHALFFFFFLRFILFYLKGKVTEKRERHRETEIFHALVHSPNGLNSRGCSGQSQEPRASSGTPTWMQGPNTWTAFHCLPRCISRELDWKWSSSQMGCWHRRQRLKPLPPRGLWPRPSMLSNTGNKVPRPDGKPDNLGLLVLDEPSTKQSDPTVLSLWLTENSKQHNVTQHVKVKSVEDAEKNPKAIDTWIESICELHRSKPPATVHYTRPMPDIDTLMQEWSPEFEELLGKVSLPTAEIDCSLAEYIDMICAILDIPVYKSRIQSLHLLFSLYSEFKNSQHFKALAEGKKAFTPPSNSTSQAGDAETPAFS
ncbi:intraflagellar transport protein 46 homolog isoform X2 [Oryctolagus cuniculus]|uniref:intraflagellar transport protein 46 homolog isoform X2 n=1 Tax=Oryctolagus cuniculus TaxID=9986 RepID=UPI0038790521